MDQKKEDTNENLLKNLADFVEEGHALGAAQERLDDEIKAVGINPEAYVSKFKGLVETRILEHRAAIHQDRVNAAAKMQALTKKFRERLARMLPTEQETLAARLEPRLAAHFRNFTSVSHADRMGMLEDAELLEKLEEIIGEEEK